MQQPHAERDPRVRTEWIRFLFSRIPASFNPERVVCAAHFGRFSLEEGDGEPLLDSPVLMGATEGETVLTLPTDWESHDCTADQQNQITVTSEHRSLQRSSTQDHGAVKRPKQGEHCFLCQEGYPYETPPKEDGFSPKTSLQENRFNHETPLQENGFKHETQNGFQTVKTEWEDINVNLKEEEEEVCIGNQLVEAPIVKVEIEEVFALNWGVKTTHVKEEEEELLIQNGNVQISGASVKKEESEEEAVTRAEEMLIPNVKEEEGALIKVKEVCKEAYTLGFDGLPEPGFHQPSNSARSGQSARTSPNQPVTTRKGRAVGLWEERGEGWTAVWVEGWGEGRPEIQAFLQDHDYTRLRQQHRYPMRSHRRMQKKTFCMSESEGEQCLDVDQTVGVLHDHQYLSAEPRSSQDLSDIPPVSDSETDSAEDTTDTLDHSSDSANDTPEVPRRSHVSSCGTSGSSDGSSTSSCETPEAMVLRCLRDHDYCREYLPQKSSMFLRSSKRNGRNLSCTEASKNPPVTRTLYSSDSDSENSKRVRRGLRFRRRTRSRRLKVLSDHSSESDPDKSSKDPQLCTRCGQVFNSETASAQCICASCSLSEGALKSSPLQVHTQTAPVVTIVCSQCKKTFSSHKDVMAHTCSRVMVLNGGSSARFLQLNNSSSLFSVVGPLNLALNRPQPLGPTFTIVNTVQRSGVSPAQRLSTPVPPVYQINALPTGGLVSIRPRVENPADVSTSTFLPPLQPLRKDALTPAAVLQLSCTESTPTPPAICSRQTQCSPMVMDVNQSRDLSLQKGLDLRWKTKARFLCRHCGVSLRQPSFGIRHRYQHRGPRPHKCQCGRAFQQRLHLLRHQIRHAESSRYVCATCGKTFYGTQRLAWHHHKALKSPPPNGKIHAKRKCRNLFPCSCGQMFPRPAALLWHMLKNSEARGPCLKKLSLS